MRPTVTLAMPDGTEVQVGPGAFIGRLVHAAVCIDHPQVSEAHALVSLRGVHLYLLALRGPLAVRGKRVPHVRLERGQRIELVPDVVLEVVDLELPTEVLALEGVRGGPVPLVRSSFTLHAGRPPRLEPGYDPAGDGWIWSANGLRLRLDGVTRPLRAGDSFELAGQTLSARELPLSAIGVKPTISASGRDPALRIVSRYETLHVHREDGAVFSIGGIPARIVAELVEYGVPTPWELVARSIWPDATDEYVMRQNWDRHLKRLRRKLKEAGFRDNLVRSDGRGNVELHVMPSDVIVDDG